MIVAAWAPLVLGLDQVSDYAGQCGLALATWLLLFALLRRQDGRTRAQVAVVVVFATLIEFIFSAGLHVYDYRLHEGTFLMRVPMFVPPGHGLIYLAALSVGRDRWVRRHGRALLAAVLVVGGGYALWGVTLSPRSDVLGVLWYGALVWFVWRGRQPLVFVGAFIVVTWLELLGTGLGAWTWAHHDPTGLISIGNPPSGVPGGYGFFDAAALTLGPWVARQASAVRTRASSRAYASRSPRSVRIRDVAATNLVVSSSLPSQPMNAASVPITRRTPARTACIETPVRDSAPA